MSAVLAPEAPRQPPPRVLLMFRGHLSIRLHAFLRIVVVVQFVAIVAFGCITIVKYPLWSQVDEGAHFDNVAYIAQHHALPVLGHALSTDQELSIEQGRYPKPTTLNRHAIGLSGLSYEAFQPPLYYLVATPFFFLSGNWHTKAIILRFLGLGLLVVAIALLARLSRHVLKERWLLGLAGGMLIFLMPGVIVRSVTISNVSLAVPLAIATITELWIAWERRSSWRLITGGLLVGCGVLTDLYLVEMVPIFVALAAYLFWHDRSRANRLRCLAGVVVAAVVTLPWFAFNESKYHALTASALAKNEQLSIVNPQHLSFGLGQLPGLTVHDLFNPLLPQEWAANLASHAWFAYAANLFEVLIVPTAAVLAIAMQRRLASTGYWLLAAPFVCNLILCWYVDYGQQWQSGAMVARYVYPTLPLLGLFVVAAAVPYLKSARTWATTLVVNTAFLVILWIHLVPTISGTLVAKP